MLAWRGFEGWFFRGWERGAVRPEGVGGGGPEGWIWRNRGELADRLATTVEHGRGTVLGGRNLEIGMRQGVMKMMGLMAGLMGLMGGGCQRYLEGGSGLVDDTHTYVSTSEAPKTVTLKDTATHEVLWTVEVPVGRKLVVRFYPDQFKDNIAAPDMMRWDLIDREKETGGLANMAAVPKSRLLEWTLREGGERAPNAKTNRNAKAGGAAEKRASALDGM